MIAKYTSKIYLHNVATDGAIKRNASILHGQVKCWNKSVEIVVLILTVYLDFCCSWFVSMHACLFSGNNVDDLRQEEGCLDSKDCFIFYWLIKFCSACFNLKLALRLEKMFSFWFSRRTVSFIWQGSPHETGVINCFMLPDAQVI